MDFLFELLLELIAEGTFELSKSRKVPKYIRYPLICIVVLFFAAVIGVILFVGIASLKESLLLALLFIALAIFMLVASIMKFKKIYLTRKGKE